MCPCCKAQLEKITILASPRMRTVRGSLASTEEKKQHCRQCQPPNHNRVTTSDLRTESTP
eukprot:3765102-Ditylum_brightwellii.AAC.1